MKGTATFVCNYGGNKKLLIVDLPINFETMMANINSLDWPSVASFKYISPGDKDKIPITVGNDRDWDTCIREYLEYCDGSASAPERISIIIDEQGGAAIDPTTLIPPNASHDDNRCVKIELENTENQEWRACFSLPVPRTLSWIYLALPPVIIILLLLKPTASHLIQFENSINQLPVHGTQKFESFHRIWLTRRYTIDELQDNNEEGSFMVFGYVRDEGPWWYSACVCGKAIQPQACTYYCDFCQHHVINVTPRYRIKIAVEDENGHGIFVLFDRESAYLLKKACSGFFSGVNKDSSVVCGDTYPEMFQVLVEKKLLLKVDTKSVGADKYFETFRVKRVCDDPAIIAMFRSPNYDADDECTPVKASPLPKCELMEEDTSLCNHDLCNSLNGCNPGEGESTNVKKESTKYGDFLTEGDSQVAGREDMEADVDFYKHRGKEIVVNDESDDDLTPEIDMLLKSPLEKAADVLAGILDGAPEKLKNDMVEVSKSKEI